MCSAPEGQKKEVLVGETEKEQWEEVIPGWISFQFLCSHNVRLPWQRDEEGIRGIGDEPPAGDAEKNDESSMSLGRLENSRHKSSAEGGELLALH